MANDILLQEGHPVDENLRPLKIGGKSSSLELSQYENGSGARITGDLEVTGNIKGNVKDVVLDLTTINSTNLTIDDAGDITLSAAGGDIIMDDGAGNNIFTFNTATPEFRIIDDADNPDDYCSIAVGAGGLTTISTNDDTGVIADLIFEVDGEINFNVKEPFVRFKDETTEIGFVKALSGEAFGFHGSLGNSNGVLIRAQNGDINLESADDVIMDANSGIFQFQLNGDTDDLCTLTVASNGATTIATADSDGTVGDLTLDADGGLKLDAASIADGYGVQFLLNGTKVGDITGHHSATNFLLYENIGASTDDYFSIATYANGATTFKTVDAAGADGYLQFSIDGHVIFDACSVGFNKIAETFSDDSVIGSGGTHDTHIDFRTNNKISLAVTGNITNLNLIFPAVSGNFLLLLTYDGDHTITNYKVYEADESAADGDADVFWSGGTKPDNTASGIDILSFFYDATDGSDKCYGVASLAFATP